MMPSFFSLKPLTLMSAVLLLVALPAHAGDDDDDRDGDLITGGTLGQLADVADEIADEKNVPSDPLSQAIQEIVDFIRDHDLWPGITNPDLSTSEDSGCESLEVEIEDEDILDVLNGIIDAETGADYAFENYSLYVYSTSSNTAGIQAALYNSDVEIGMELQINETGWLSIYNSPKCMVD